jgi:arsenate reductase
MSKPDKLKVLFLCTGNSCRSQMAEGFCRRYHPESIDASSCGTERHGLNPLAVKVMQECGIDLSGNLSKTIEDLDGMKFDYVITVCGHASESCPVFPVKTKVVHRGFDDPPRLAANSREERDALVHYRRVRDEISDYIQALPDSLERS